MTRPIALITGASRGIGRSTALRLARDHDIVAVARTAADLESLKGEIEQAGASYRAIVLDLADHEATDRLLTGVQCDVLVNNAGVGPMKPFLALTREEWHRIVDVNFNSLFHVTRAVLPGMIERRRGHVVIVGSIAGRSAFVGGTAYAGSKHAVAGFAECLMLEVREHGVKVSTVNPGSVATAFSERADDSWMLSPDEVAESIAQVVATPHDVLVHSLEIRALMPPKKK
ncbi:MAG TPA: SDR family oxidoreductase [Gemmatimonadaceae bacterium]|nr:SDR family oxidoreductase [Gemmatimonadaceae bacterium]